jgi:hypothetical protein
MRRKIVVLLFALTALFGSVSLGDEMKCEEGHAFVWQGQYYCNPGPGPEGCLRCSLIIIVSD